MNMMMFNFNSNIIYWFAIKPFSFWAIHITIASRCNFDNIHTIGILFVKLFYHIIKWSSWITKFLSIYSIRGSIIRLRLNRFYHSFSTGSSIWSKEEKKIYKCFRNFPKLPIYNSRILSCDDEWVMKLI